MNEYKEVPINLQRKELYGPSFGAESLDQRADDIRRKLIIDYSVRPEDRHPGYERRDVWKEIANDIMTYTGGGEEVLMLDAGTSSGYMIDQVLSSGFKGQIIGVDIEANHLPLLAREIEEAHPGARVVLGEADAEKIDKIKMLGGKVHRIPKKSFSVTTQLFVAHHTMYPEKAIEAALDATENDGYVFFGARAVGHLDNVYATAVLAANYFGLREPESYYSKYDFFRMEEYLSKSERCEIVKVGSHVDYLWIDGDEEGWTKFSNAVTALLPDMNRRSSRKITQQEMRSYLEDTLKPGYIDGAIRYYGGYILDYAAEKYFAVQVKK